MGSRVILSSTSNRGRGRKVILGGTSNIEFYPWGTERMYWLLEKGMMRTMGFELSPALDVGKLGLDSTPLPKDADIVYIHLTLHSYDIRGVVEHLKGCPNATVIFIPGGDRRMWDLDRAGVGPFLERVSVILDNQKNSWVGNNTFVQAWPKHAHKHIYFPNCIAPDSWCGWEYNEDPELKCILSGRIGGRYELRNFALTQMAKDAEFRSYVDFLGHPNGGQFFKQIPPLKHHLKIGKKLSPVDAVALSGLQAAEHLDMINEGSVVKEEYQALLHKYLGGLAIVGNHLNQVVISKHTEIPAIGSLMISERFKDLDLMGFIPEVHYAEVTRENLVSRVVDICRNPAEYSVIRKSGMEFVRKYHGLKSRLEFMEKVVDNILAGKRIEEAEYGK